MYLYNFKKMTAATFFLYTSITLLSIGFIGLLFSKVNNLKINVTYVGYCREVLKWTGPILYDHGIKYYPNLVLRYSKSEKHLGLYNPNNNTIIIYLKNHKGADFVSQLTKTVLHETYHHIQSKTDPAFTKLTNYKKYGYYNNRIEVEARNFENAHYKKCVKKLYDNGFLKKES